MILINKENPVVESFDKLAGHNVCAGKSQGGQENEKMDVRLRAGNSGDR